MSASAASSSDRADVMPYLANASTRGRARDVGRVAQAELIRGRQRLRARRRAAARRGRRGRRRAHDRIVGAEAIEQDEPASGAPSFTSGAQHGGDHALIAVGEHARCSRGRPVRVGSVPRIDGERGAHVPVGIRIEAGQNRHEPLGVERRRSTAARRARMAGLAIRQHVDQRVGHAWPPERRRAPSRPRAAACGVGVLPPARFAAAAARPRDRRSGRARESPRSATPGSAPVEQREQHRNGRRDRASAPSPFAANARVYGCGRSASVSKRRQRALVLEALERERHRPPAAPAAGPTRRARPTPARRRPSAGRARRAPRRNAAAGVSRFDSSASAGSSRQRPRQAA